MMENPQNMMVWKDLDIPIFKEDSCNVNVLVHVRAYRVAPGYKLVNRTFSYSFIYRK